MSNEGFVITEDVARIIVNACETGDFSRASEFVRHYDIHSFEDWRKVMEDDNIDMKDFPVLFSFCSDMPKEDMKRIREITDSALKNKEDK